MNQEPYTPPPTAPAQPAYGAPPTQPPKSKKTLIIALIVLALFLCCCTTGGGIVAFGYLADQESDVLPEESVTDLDDTTVEPSDTTDTSLEEWYAWNPTIGDPFLDSPTPRQQAIAEEIAVDLYPEFTLLETYVQNGKWSEEDQMYFMDYYNVRMSLDNDPSVEIGEYFWVWSKEQVEEGGKGTEMSTFAEDDILGVLDDGTEYVYSALKVPMHHGMSTDTGNLLITIAEEWPGALITYVGHVDDNESEAHVALTTWDHFYTTEEFEGVQSTYSLQGGQWLLDSYEWVLLD